MLAININNFYISDIIPTSSKKKKLRIIVYDSVTRYGPRISLPERKWLNSSNLTSEAKSIRFQESRLPRAKLEKEKKKAQSLSKTSEERVSKLRECNRGEVT